MTQEGITDGLFRKRKAIAIPRDRGAGEIERIAFRIHDDLHRIRVESFFCMMNGYRQRGHSDLTLRQVFGHLTDNDSGDHRLVTLHVYDNRIITETAFLNHFRQTLGAGLVICAGHAYLTACRLNRTSDIRMIGGNNHAVSTGFTRTLKDMHNHRLAVDIHQRFTRQTR